MLSSIPLQHSEMSGVQLVGARSLSSEFFASDSTSKRTFWIREFTVGEIVSNLSKRRVFILL